MEREGITEVPLSEKNERLMEGLKNFVKYNPILMHMNLTSTGLPA